MDVAVTRVSRSMVVLLLLLPEEMVNFMARGKEDGWWWGFRAIGDTPGQTDKKREKKGG